MPTIVKFRRGTTAQNNLFTGSEGEISVDLDKNTLRIHDGSTQGGSEILAADATQTITNKTPNQSWIPATDSAYDLGSPTNKWRSLYLSGQTLYLGTIVLKDNNGVLSIQDSTGGALAGSFSTLETTGNVTVGGDLVVNGTTTTINSTTLDVDDLNITIAKGAADATAANGAGLTVDGANATITYVSGTDTWDFNKAFGTSTNVLTNYTTTQLGEGNNLYYTTARADSDFDVRLATKTTTDLAEGSGLYYTTARHDSDFLVLLATRTTTNLTEGDNLYYTRGRFDSALGDATSQATIRGYFSASGDLTYNSGTGEFSFDVENVYTQTNFDSDFNTSLDAAAIGGVGLTYDAANNTLSIDSSELASYFSTDNITEGSNLYYTDARARASISVTDAGGDGSLSYDNGSGVITYTGPSASEVRAHFSGGTGVTITNGEVAIGQSVGTGDSVTFASLQTAGNVVVGGNLTVNGTTTSVNSTTVDVADLNITVAKGATNSAEANGAGLTVDGANATLTYVSATDKWSFNKGLVATNFEGVYLGADSDIDARLSGGTGITYSSGTISTNDAEIVHDNLSGFVANEHIDHSTVTITAGSGLTGGGDITTTRTLNVGAGNGITVNADDIDVDMSVFSTTDLAEGDNLYYTTARADSDFDVRLATKTTDNLTEGSNLYYTDARARAAISASGDLSYNSTTGVVSFTERTDAEVRGLVSATDAGGDGSFSYNSSTGVFTYTGPSAAEVRAHFSGGTGVTITDGTVAIGQSVGTGDNVVFNQVTAALVGNVTGQVSDISNHNTGDLSEGSNLYYTTARADSDAKNAVSGGTGITYTASTGVIATNDGQIVHDNLSGFVANEHIDHSSVTVTAGSGLTGGGDITTSRTLNIGQGTGITVSADAISTNDGEIVHDNLSGFVANEHIDHSTVSVTAGSGLTGGGTIEATRTLNIGEGTGITVSADAISTNDAEIVHDNLSGFVANEHIDHTSVTLTAGKGLSGGGNIAASRTFAIDSAELYANFSLDGFNDYVANEHIDHSSVSITAGSGLTGGGNITTSRTLNIGEGTGITVSADAISTNDAEIVHDNLSGFVANEHIDHTSVTLTAGNGLTGGGNIAASRTFAVGAGTGVTVTADAVSIGQDVGTSANVTFSSVTTTGNVTVGGNLQVTGTTTTVNSQNLNVTDNMIYMNAGESDGSPTQSIDVGWAGNVNDNGTYTHVGMFRDATDDTFKVMGAYTPEPDAALEIDTGHASFQLGKFAALTLSGKYLGADSDIDARLSGGTGITYSSGTISTNDGQIVHDNLSGFVANEHINHSSVTITAGSGLTGGGDITTSRTLNIGEGTGITVSADAISTNDAEIVHDNLSGFVANEHIDHSTVSITAGSGLTGGGTIAATRTLNIGEGTGITVSADAISTNDAEIVHDNLSGFVANEHIDHSTVSITAGSGLTGGGTIAATRTLNIGEGTGITVSADAISTNDGEIVHDNLSGFVANEHIDHTSVSINAGKGLVGGGTIAATRTLDIDSDNVKAMFVGGTGITYTSATGTFAQDGTGTIGAGTYGSTADATKIDQITVDALGRITAITTGATGDIAGVTAGTGLSGGGTSGTVTLNLDFSELTDMTGDISGTTEFILQDGTTESRKAASEIKLSFFNNDAGWTTNTGTVTSVAAGSYLTGGTITTTGTLAVDATSANTASKVVARDGSGNFSAGTITAALTGNASTATTLQTARTINGVSFNGSANITVEPYVEDDAGTNATRYLTFVDNSTAGHKRLNEDANLTYNPSTNTLTTTTFSGALSGNASTATKWATGRTISLTGDVTGTSGSFDGSGNLSFSTALAANTVSSTELVSATSLVIYNSAGSALKTLYGAGS